MNPLAKIPRDKLLHLVAGAAAAALGLLLWHLAMLLPLLAAHPLATGLSLGGLMVGLTKEIADHMDNVLLRKRGEPALHGVTVGDALVTWLGASAVSGGLVWAGLA
jgi:hypothetical protein